MNVFFIETLSVKLIRLMFNFKEEVNINHRWKLSKGQKIEQQFIMKIKTGYNLFTFLFFFLSIFI